MPYATGRSTVPDFRFALNVFLQSQGTAVFGVTRTVEQRDRPVGRRLADRRPGIGREIEFGKVATAEFLPLLRVVLVPFPEIRAGSYVLQPTVDSQRGLFHSAR